MAIFWRKMFIYKTYRGCFFLFDKVLSISQPLLNQKYNVGWFLPKRFIDLFRVCYIISRNHSSTFMLINLQKTKPCWKWNTIAKAICSDTRLLIHSTCLHVVERCEKVENINTLNYYKTISKKRADEKKTDLFFVFCKCV